jgi:hypothetical protein
MRNFLYNKSDILIAIIIIVVAAIIIWTRVDAIMGSDKGGGDTPNVSSGEQLEEPDTPPTDAAIAGDQTPADGQTAEGEAVTSSEAIEGEPPAGGEEVSGEEAPPADTEPVEFTVEIGSAASTVAKGLESAGLVETADAFLSELTAQNAETKLKAGTFKIAPGTSVSEIVKKLTG